MRADRLLAIIMLLQARERMTGEELAEELEVSVRTIYRDLEALSTAGIPVYAERGVGGGIRLVENYRTSLNLLTKEELSTLLMLNIPGPLAMLDAGQKLKMALLKVLSTLPASTSEDQPQPRIYMDWAWWGQSHQPVPFLQELYVAAKDDRLVILHYHLWNGMQIAREAEPYGLVSKAGLWYLVYAGLGRFRLRLVTELDGVEMTGRNFIRQKDFRLEECWKSMSAAVENELETYPVTVNVAPNRLPLSVRTRWGGSRRYDQGDGQAGEDGWVRLEVRFDSLEAARTQLLGLGSAVKVVEPEPLRLSLVDYARNVLKVYGE